MTSGYSAATSLKVRSHRSPAKVSTFVLCTSVRCLRRAAAGQLEGVADAALDADAGVDRALGGDLVGRALAEEPALAGVGALGVLADHDEVVRPVGSDERPLVDVQVEVEAHLEQQAALDHARAARRGCRPRRAGGRRGPATRRGSRRGAPRRRAGSGRRRGRSRPCRAPRPRRATTLSASAMTSGPIPSPPMTPILWLTSDSVSAPRALLRFDPGPATWTPPTTLSLGHVPRNDKAAHRGGRPGAHTEVGVR